MSEFYFDYKCIALAGPATRKGDKALDFFLFQDPISNSMKVQVYIPVELQKEHSAIHLYRLPNGIGFPDLETIPNKRRVIPMEEIAKENGFDITPNPDSDKYDTLSCMGVIAFIKKGKKEPLKQDMYKFGINFTRRERILYIIEENKSNRIDIKIFYPRLLKDITLNILSKNRSKPLLIKERKDDNNYLKDNNGEKRTITLNKLGDNFGVATVKIPVNNTKGPDFRLVFADEEDNKFYMLVDESEITAEEKDLITDDKKNNHSDFKYKDVNYRKVRMLKCPYCNNLIAEGALTPKKGVYTCQGKYITDRIPNYPHKKVLICSSNLKEEAKQVPGAIFAEKFILPQQADKLPMMNIAVAGFPQCGKTIYLASLLNINLNSSYEYAPFELMNLVKHMAHKDKRTSYCEMLTYDEKTNSLTKIQEDQRETLHDGVNVKGRYAINVGQGVEKQTAKEAAEILSWNPICYKLGDLGFTYFYDCPGEAFKKDYTKKLRTFDVADGIIAIIDGDTYSKNAKGEIKNKNPIGTLKDTLNKISDLSLKGIDLSTLPIAVVFTKLDLKITNYLPNVFKEHHDDCFDENCHILWENIDELYPSNHKYHGSDLERHIDCSSYELLHYLKSFSLENDSTLREIINTYKNLKFFACSALGSDGVFDLGDKTAKVQYRPRRLRIELPIIWLMHQKGLIK